MTATGMLGLIITLNSAQKITNSKFHLPNMRILVTIFFVSLFCLQVQAEETYVIEPSNIEVRYKTSYEGEMKKKPNRKGRAIYILRKGQTTSQYFCYETLRSDSLHFVSGGFELLRQEEKERNLHPEKFSPKTNTPCCREYLYKDIANGNITIYTNVMGDRFRIEDSPFFKWKLVPDSTKSILGHECQLAETDFRGRHWKVWFTLDIPLPIGPWKFGGLPGLILQAESPDFLNIEGFEIITQNLTPIKYYNYYKKKNIDIDRAKFLKMKSNPYQYPNGVSIVPGMELE